MAATEADLDRLRKIRALKASPFKGEADNATAMLAAQLAKYGLVESDLDKPAKRAPSPASPPPTTAQSAWKPDLAWEQFLHEFLARSGVPNAEEKPGEGWKGMR